MVDTLSYILKKFDISDNGHKLPIKLNQISRQGLAELMAEMGFKVGVEIGVQEAAFSEWLCRAIPGGLIFSIDPWRHYKGYRDHVRQDKLDRFYEFTKKRLAPYPNSIIMRKYSMDALADFQDESLDFVYIDGNHDFRHCTEDIDGWSKKVRVGGIVAGHDYHAYEKPNNIHVVQVIPAYAFSYDISPWFITNNKELDIWKNNKPIHQPPSWFWVKQDRSTPRKI